MRPPAFDEDELRALIDLGVSILVATRSAHLEPHATRATGLRLLGGDRIEVLLPRATSSRSIAHLEDNGEIAVLIATPRTFAAMQLKGRATGFTATTPEHLELSEAQLRAFADALAPMGQTRKQARNAWSFDAIVVSVDVTSAFAQTPGPGAGARVGGTRDG